MRTHTGDQCEVLFKRESILTVHMRSHHVEDYKDKNSKADFTLRSKPKCDVNLESQLDQEVQNLLKDHDNEEEQGQNLLKDHAQEEEQEQNLLKYHEQEEEQDPDLLKDHEQEEEQNPDLLKDHEQEEEQDTDLIKDHE